MCNGQVQKQAENVNPLDLFFLKPFQMCCFNLFDDNNSVNFSIIIKHSDNFVIKLEYYFRFYLISIFILPPAGVLSFSQALKDG